MIKSIWFGKNQFYWLLLPFSLLYSIAVFLRRCLYSVGLIKRWRAPVPVIIVGNLTVGGNGKTPLVIGIAQQLATQGYRIGIVSRGYGGKSKRYPFIIDNQTATKEAGDEPILIFQRTNMPIAVAPKRCEAAKLLLKNYPIDLIISDDGLQHYALDRDCEVVVIDGHFGFGNGYPLPAGPMRENRSRLSSVDLIVINGRCDKLPLPETCPITTMTIKVCEAVNLVSGEKCLVTMLSPVIAIAGIGHPDRFFIMLKEMGVVVKNSYSFPDHYVYDANQLLSLADERSVLLMTEKDAVKCRSFAQPNWWYLPIEVALDRSVIDVLLNALYHKKEG